MRRYAAPVAFLAAVTIAVLLIRAFVDHGGRHAATPATTTTQTTTPTHHRKRHAHHQSTVRTYTVQTGDTFGSIAEKTGTTVARLEQLNPRVSPTALQVGQRIRVR